MMPPPQPDHPFDGFLDRVGSLLDGLLGLPDCLVGLSFRVKVDLGVKNAPVDHRDLQGVVHAEARDHGIDKDYERLPPRQRRESRKARERQDGARDRLGREG